MSTRGSCILLLKVSAGSGFAPFMSFIEFREQAARAGAKTGPIFIFHGCRYKEYDFLDLLLKEACTALNIKTFRAYSRADPGKLDHVSFRSIYRQILGGEQCPKTLLVKRGYVQDLIAEKGEMVADIARDGGYMYACGGVSVVTGIRNQLKRTLEEQGSMSLEKLIASRRFQEEKFG